MYTRKRMNEDDEKGSAALSLHVNIFFKQTLSLFFVQSSVFPLFFSLFVSFASSSLPVGEKEGPCLCRWRAV